MKLLIVTDLSFPGSAMASRLLSFAKLFNEIGYKVHIIAGKSGDKKTQLNKVIRENYYSYEIVESKRSERLQSYIGNENLIDRVDNYLANNEVDLVFITSLNALFNKTLKVIRKHNKKVILEQCEWYDPSSFSFGKYDPRYIRFLNNIQNNYKKVDGIIAISRLLEYYFKTQGVKTIRIPSITDVKNKPVKPKLDINKIKLVFTGNTSNSKELLKPVLEALNSCNEFKERFILDIYGSNKEQVLNNIKDEGLLKELESIVEIKGRIPQCEVDDVLLNADYQIFIRPNRRSSNAGFPTKLCEAMSLGTPCITNDTGDISLVLKDEENGFVCKGNKVKDLIEVFNKCLNLNEEDINKMRDNCKKDALSFFDYRNYIESVNDLIKNL